MKGDQPLIIFWTFSKPSSSREGAFISNTFEFISIPARPLSSTMLKTPNQQQISLKNQIFINGFQWNCELWYYRFFALFLIERLEKLRWVSSSMSKSGSSSESSHSEYGSDPSDSVMISWSSIGESCLVAIEMIWFRVLGTEEEEECKKRFGFSTVVELRFEFRTQLATINNTPQLASYLYFYKIKTIMFFGTK